MQVCQYHAAMDERVNGLIATLRCAHLGSEYVHERRPLLGDGTFFNRVDTDDRTKKPELLWVSHGDDAEFLWKRMNKAMLDGEPMGKAPYSVGVTHQSWHGDGPVPNY